MDILERLVYLPIIMLWIGAAVWVLWDSLQRTGEWGFLWGFLALGMAPIIVPLYIFTAYRVDRPAPAWVKREQEFQNEKFSSYKGLSEFDRVRFIEAAAGGAGTLYAGPGMQPSPNGAKLFVDAHADHLLATRQFDEAFVYLYDLYLLALEDNDPRAEQTYKFYLHELPHGPDLLKRARDRQISPGMLKAGGMSLIDSIVPVSVDRPRPVSTDPTTAPHHRANAEAAEIGLQAGISLERLLNAQEDLPPPAPLPVRPTSVQPPAPVKRTPHTPKVPF